MRPRTTLGLLALTLAIGAASWLSSHDSGEAAYPGGNGVLLFESPVAGTVHVFQMNSDGNNLHKLTNLLTPSVEPGAGGSGLHVVVGSGENIWIVTADGGHATQITSDPAADMFPALSRDESMVAFATDRDGNREIYTMTATGQQETPMTDDAATDTLPRWSPDGATIAFDSNRFGDFEVLLMDVATKAVTRLTDANGNDEAPDWSPDGTRIVFSSTRDGNSEIYVINSDGENAVRLTNDAANDGDPVWSPDGSQIAFMSDRDGDYEVYVMPATGGDPTQLTHDTDYQYSLDWMPIVAETVAGDADCNSVVNAEDGVAALVFLGELTPVAACVLQANIFCLDGLGYGDVLLLLKHLAGFELRPDLPDECPLPGE